MHVLACLQDLSQHALVELYSARQLLLARGFESQNKSCNLEWPEPLLTAAEQAWRRRALDPSCADPIVGEVRRCGPSVEVQAPAAMPVYYIHSEFTASERTVM